MRTGHWKWGAALALLLGCGPLAASPWAEVGDNLLRSDIELLAASGVVDSITTHWPLPWQSLRHELEGRSLDGQSEAVRAAARRILARARVASAHGVSASAYLDATNKVDTVYGFDGMGRGEGQAQFSLEDNLGAVSGRVSLGALSQNFRGNTLKLMPEGTYLSADLAGALVYAGYLDHWWGPGEISALSLSNNARPMPQVGIERADTEASHWPVLRWLGPWQLEFLLAYMDGPRIQPDTYYNGLRFTFNPAPGLEIGIARTEEFCGQGHNCVPIRDYFDLDNDPNHPNHTNDEGVIDVKYSRSLGHVPFQVYMQLMNEDSSPFTHSGTSHLFGASIFVPAPTSPLKLTVEYTDSVPTKDIFSFGDVIHGFAYNNATYPDGMRYRGRTLGFSLDSDSRLLSLQASWSDAAGRFYELSFHHANISNALIGSVYAPSYNVVSTAPVLVNLGEARVSLPLDWGSRATMLDLDGRLQDDQPRPSHGFAATIEAAFRFNM